MGRKRQEDRAPTGPGRKAKRQKDLGDFSFAGLLPITSSVFVTTSRDS